MHICLTNSEVLGSICSYLRRVDLLSVALVCKYLKPIALYYLWRELRSLAPLIQCFPRNTWRIRMEKQPFFKQTSFELLKPLAAQDWKFVRPYLPNIQAIKLWYMEDVPDDILASMLSSFPDAKLFPHLHTLHWGSDCSDIALAFIGTSIGPQLEHLSLSLESKSSEAQRSFFMSTLATTSPFLKTFKLSAESYDLPTISASVCRWNYLQVLEVPNLSQTALVHASQLPGLQRLILNEAHSTHIVSFPPVPLPAFPALKTLKLRKTQHLFASEIHTVISSPKYSCFEGNFLGRVRPSELEDFFSQLASMPYRLDFIDFSHQGRPDKFESAQYTITADTFRCIIPVLTQVTHLNLASFSTFDLADGFISDLAQACPNLTFIWLGTACSTGRRHRATLASYAHVVHHCPQIKVLGLVVDASQVDELLQVNAARGFQQLPTPANFCFDVGDSYIDDPAPVAAILSALLNPHIRGYPDISTSLDCPSNIAEKWAAVQQLLPYFLAVRAQESWKASGKDDASR